MELTEAETTQGIDLGKELVDTLASRGMSGEFQPTAAILALGYALINLSYRAAEPGSEIAAIRYALDEVNFIAERLIERLGN